MKGESKQVKLTVWKNRMKAAWKDMETLAQVQIERAIDANSKLEEKAAFQRFGLKGAILRLSPPSHLLHPKV